MPWASRPGPSGPTAGPARLAWSPRARRGRPVMRPAMSPSSPPGRFLVVCCWGDGQVLFYELDADGGILAGPPAESRDPTATLPTPARPEPRPRGLMLADGRVMTTDLGHDLLRIWNVRSGPGPGPVLDHELVLPQGSGPRHLVQHPGGSVFVVTEYSIEVAVAARSPDTGDFRLAFVGPATAGGALAGDSAAEIALAADGRHAYVGVRGSNRIACWRWRPEARRCSPVADVPSGGDWPRHHLVRDRIAARRPRTLRRRGHVPAGSGERTARRARRPGGPGLPHSAGSGRDFSPTPAGVPAARW